MLDGLSSCVGASRWAGRDRQVAYAARQPLTLMNTCRPAATLTHSLAYELWKELEGSVGELDGASFRCGLNACVVMGCIDEANSLLTFMLKHKISPGLGSYNILIKFYCGAGRVYVWQGCGGINSCLGHRETAAWGRGG